MFRNNLLQQLQEYALKFPNEIETVERFDEFISTYPDCFERTLTIGHITGSAWVLNKARTHVLLTHHRKLNRWLQLGGHADGESDVLGVAMREVQEESGLEDVQALSTKIFDIDIHAIPSRRDEAEHFHYDIRYLFETMGNEDYVVSEESHDLAWVEMERVHELTTEESMLRMVRKWKAEQTY